MTKSKETLNSTIIYFSRYLSNSQKGNVGSIWDYIFTLFNKFNY